MRKELQLPLIERERAVRRNKSKCISRGLYGILCRPFLAKILNVQPSPTGLFISQLFLEYIEKFYPSKGLWIENPPAVLGFSHVIIAILAAARRCRI